RSSFRARCQYSASPARSQLRASGCSEGQRYGGARDHRSCTYRAGAAGAGGPRLGMIRALGPMLALSGVASLTYQVTWVRLLGLSMGASSAAVSTVVAAFFLGLGLGSYWVARSRRLLADSFKSYLIVEALIGVSGLVLLPVLLHLDHLMALAPWLGASLVAKFAVCMTLLLVPTLGMGATFPLMAHTLAGQQQSIGTSLSDLYGFNTMGAVLGALSSGFVFIPLLGLNGASFVACGFNLLVVAIGVAVRRRSGSPVALPSAAR